MRREGRCEASDDPIGALTGVLWLLFIGLHTTFLVQHWLGVEGRVENLEENIEKEPPTPGPRR